MSSIICLDNSSLLPDFERIMKNLGQKIVKPNTQYCVKFCGKPVYNKGNIYPQTCG